MSIICWTRCEDTGKSGIRPGYSARRPLAKLLSVTNVFNISPITSLLHHPEEVYQESSFIAPIQLQKMASELGEPNSAVILPSLITQDTQWVKNGKPSGQYLIDGAYILVNGQQKKGCHGES